jgi:hypothetical protein
MQVAANSSLVWKRESEEYQRWSRIFVRLTAVLAVAFLATGTYAYSTHVQLGDLCVELDNSVRFQSAPSVKKVNHQILREHCRS